MATLSRLFIHPVKSMRGIGVSHALADMSGFAFDRIFMVTEPDGTFITHASSHKWFALPLPRFMTVCISPRRMAPAW